MKSGIITTLLAAFITTATISAQNTEEAADKSSVSGHAVYASAGVSHIITKIDTDWTSGEPRLGCDWQAGYEWISKRKIGAGFMYSGYHSSGEIIAPEGTFKETLMIHYLAPQFAGRIPLKSEKWSLNYSVGMGLAIFSDVAKGKKKVPKHTYLRNTDYGFGANLLFGAEYRIVPNLGITASVSFTEALIKQEYMGYYPADSNDSSNGFIRVSIDLGLKYHF